MAQNKNDGGLWERFSAKTGGAYLSGSIEINGQNPSFVALNNTYNISGVFLCVVIVALITLSYVATYTVGYNSGDNNGRQYVISSIELQKCGILKKNLPKRKGD